MQLSSPWGRLAAVLTVLTLLGSGASFASEAGGESIRPEAFDYLANEGLSEVEYGSDEIVHEVVRLPAFDGAELYIEVTRPDDDGGYPVILEASPYHGTLATRIGDRILPEPRDEEGDSVGLVGYFVPRGYAVVMMDLRGTGRSQGCLDHLGPKDARDLKQVVEWAADQDWSNGRVGLTGHSYVGSTPSLAAAQNPRGLATIVPSAGLAHMYDHQFQGGVPYFLQWVGPMEAYPEIATTRFTDDNFDALVDDGIGRGEAACGFSTSSLTAGEGQLTGTYSWWHAERDWRAAATAADIPVFMVHGVNDDAARVTGMQWFTDRGGREGDKLWLGQWDHGSGCCPTRRGLQWTAVLHAWFDRHLAERDVDTGPPVEVFLADTPSLGWARAGFARTEVLESDAWPVAATTLELHPDTAGNLSEQRPAEPGSESFAGTAAAAVDPQDGGVTFSTAALESDVVFAGVPELDLVASVTVPEVHLIANLYDEDEEGRRRRLSQLAITPALRHGVSTPAPVVPGQAYELDPPAFAMGHRLRAGHKLVLRITTADPDKAPTFATDPNVTVYTGPGGTALRVPVATDPVLVADQVPLWPTDTPVGEAQPSIYDEVTVLAPGLGVALDGVTSAEVAFDVLDGFDNAELLAIAEPDRPVDLDLYLYRQGEDGEWELIARAETGDLAFEGLSAARPEPGAYLLEVVNWAGAPSDAAVSLLFRNGAGVVSDP